MTYNGRNGKLVKQSNQQGWNKAHIKHVRVEQWCAERLRMSVGALPTHSSMHSGAEIAGGSAAHVRINNLNNA